MVQPDVPRILSKKDYAAWRGCSASYVSKLIREGKLAAPALRPDGKVDRGAADAMILALRDPNRLRDEDADPIAAEEAEAGEAGDAESLVELRKAVAREQHRKIQRENDAAEGQLLERAAVEREQETAAREARDAMLRIPGQVADRLATMTDPAEIRAFLATTIAAALEAAATAEEAAAATDDADAGDRPDERP